MSSVSLHVFSGFVRGAAALRWSTCCCSEGARGRRRGWRVRTIYFLSWNYFLSDLPLQIRTARCVVCMEMRRKWMRLCSLPCNACNTQEKHTLDLSNQGRPILHREVNWFFYKKRKILATRGNTAKTFSFFRSFLCCLQRAKFGREENSCHYFSPSTIVQDTKNHASRHCCCKINLDSNITRQYPDQYSRQ